MWTARSRLVSTVLEAIRSSGQDSFTVLLVLVVHMGPCGERKTTSGLRVHVPAEVDARCALVERVARDATLLGAGRAAGGRRVDGAERVDELIAEESGRLHSDVERCARVVDRLAVRVQNADSTLAQRAVGERRQTVQSVERLGQRRETRGRLRRRALSGRRRRRCALGEAVAVADVHFVVAEYRIRLHANRRRRSVIDRWQ